MIVSIYATTRSRARNLSRLQCLEQPPQQIPTDQRDPDESQTDRQMIAKRGLDPEQRKHDDLRGNGQNVTDNDIRRGLDQRNGTRLLHVISCPWLADRIKIAKD